MAAWTTAISDLRSLLSDNADDRYFYRKKVFGNVDGSNQSFKTFEFRRVTNFTDEVLSASPLGVYINGVRLDTAKVTVDNAATGEFFIAEDSIPTAGQVVEATYYTQQFKDSELSEFLVQINNSLQFGPDFTQLDPMLREAALHLAAGDALRKLGVRWTMRASDTFLLEEAPKKEALGTAESYFKMAELFSNRGTKLRDDRYGRAGQSLAPNFVNNFGRVSNVTPRR